MLTVEELEALARARAAIEAAIVTLKVHRQSMNRGQIKAVKRILYNVPEDPTP